MLRGSLAGSSALAAFVVVACAASAPNRARDNVGAASPSPSGSVVRSAPPADSSLVLAAVPEKKAPILLEHDGGPVDVQARLDAMVRTASPADALAFLRDVGFDESTLAETRRLLEPSPDMTAVREVGLRRAEDLDGDSVEDVVADVRITVQRGERDRRGSQWLAFVLKGVRGVGFVPAGVRAHGDMEHPVIGFVRDISALYDLRTHVVLNWRLDPKGGNFRDEFEVVALRQGELVTLLRSPPLPSDSSDEVIYRFGSRDIERRQGQNFTHRWQWDEPSQSYQAATPKSAPLPPRHASDGVMDCEDRYSNEQGGCTRYATSADQPGCRRAAEAARRECACDVLDLVKNAPDIEKEIPARVKLYRQICKR